VKLSMGVEKLPTTTKLPIVVLKLLLPLFFFAPPFRHLDIYNTYQNFNEGHNHP
jgi:hypothetical protein